VNPLSHCLKSAFVALGHCILKANRATDFHPVAQGVLDKALTDTALVAANSGPVKMVIIEFSPVCRGKHGGSKTLETHGAAKLKRWGKRGGRPVLEKPSGKH
jgi:hypothetical protein